MRSLSSSRRWGAVLLLALTAGTAAPGETRWRDSITGTHFGIFSTSATWKEANRLCRERGWDVFNFGYLGAEEQKRFLQSEALRALAWERKFAGEPAEHEAAQLWMSSESTAIVTVGDHSRSVNYLSLQRFAGESEARSKVAWGSDDDGTKQVLCMYQSHTWVGCAHEVVCRYERPEGAPYSIRWSIYEYGPHEGVALERLRERAKQWPSTGGRCELQLRDPHCLDYRKL